MSPYQSGVRVVLLMAGSVLCLAPKDVDNRLSRPWKIRQDDGLNNDATLPSKNTNGEVFVSQMHGERGRPEISIVGLYSNSEITMRKIMTLPIRSHDMEKTLTKTPREPTASRHNSSPSRQLEASTSRESAGGVHVEYLEFPSALNFTEQGPLSKHLLASNYQERNKSIRYGIHDKLLDKEANIRRLGIAQHLIKEKANKGIQIQDWQTSERVRYGKNLLKVRHLCSSSKSVADAVVDVLQSMLITQLHLVFEGDPDVCFLEKLWKRNVAILVLDAETWWTLIFKYSYSHHSQHILVGTLDWIVATLEKNTRWIWVPIHEPSASFKACLDRVTNSLQEGIRGVLVFGNFSLLSSTGNGRMMLTKESHVEIGGIVAPGDGSWFLKRIGVWNSGMLEILRPIWPSPSLNLLKRIIRITCIQKPKVFRFLEGGKEGLDESYGYVSVVMQIARKHLNFTDRLVPTQGFGLRESNGSWNGMVGVLHRKEADMSPLDFSPSLSRSAVVEFSKPIGEDTVVILSKAPAIVIKPFLLLQIFSPLSWTCIIFSIVILGTILEIMVRFESAHGCLFTKDMKTHEQLSNCFKIFVHQNSPKWPTGSGSRIAASGGMLIAVIIGDLYSGSITAFFAIPFRSESIDTAKDLLESNMRPALRSRTHFYATLLAENGILFEARDRAAAFSGPEISTWEFFKTVADGTFALADVYSSAVGRANSFEKRGERCQFHLSREPLRTDTDVFAFMKNSPILYQFDDTMQKLRHFGIIDHIKKQYYSVPCESEVSSDGPKPMSVVQVQGSFYVLSIGLLIGLLIFLLEIIWQRTKM